MNSIRKPQQNSLQKSMNRTIFISALLTMAFFYIQSCQREGNDLKKKLVDQKIISLGEAAGLTQAGGNPFEKDPQAIENGKGHYLTLCAVCHGDNGRGNAGPDLLDEISLHGDDNFDVFSVIMNGVRLEHMKMNPPRGKMPGYKNILGARKILEVMAWLESEKEKVAKENQE